MIPKPLRDSLGLRPGEVKLTADGVPVHVEPLIDDTLDERGDWLVIPSSGHSLTSEAVRELRDVHVEVLSGAGRSGA